MPTGVRTLRRSQMNIQKTDTAVVFIDPQNDVLSEKGSSWGAVGASVTENHTVENMEAEGNPRAAWLAVDDYGDLTARWLGWEMRRLPRSAAERDARRTA
jgi:hypothetical protein